VSHYRRLATAGLALATAGVFISAPAQAAQPAAVSSATAHAAAAPAKGAAGSAFDSGYKSFSSTAKTPGQTAVASRPVLPDAAKGAATSKATSSSIIYVLADPVHCTKELGLGTSAVPYCLLQSAVNAAVSGDTIEVFQNNDQDLEFSESVTISNANNLTIIGEGGIGVGDAAPNANIALNIEYSSNITVENLELDSSNATTVSLYDDSDVTFNGDSLLMDQGPYNVLDIGTGTSGTSITRSTLGDDGGGEDVEASGNPQNTVLASNVMNSRLNVDVLAWSVSGIDIVGNTIERGCGGAVDAETSWSPGRRRPPPARRTISRTTRM
jgi:hypothetical protein